MGNLKVLIQQFAVITRSPFFFIDLWLMVCFCSIFTLWCNVFRIVMPKKKRSWMWDARISHQICLSYLYNHVRKFLSVTFLFTQSIIFIWKFSTRYNSHISCIKKVHSRFTQYLTSFWSYNVLKLTKQFTYM